MSEIFNEGDLLKAIWWAQENSCITAEYDAVDPYCRCLEVVRIPGNGAMVPWVRGTFRDGVRLYNLAMVEGIQPVTS